MASTYSTSLRLELMATGDQSGTWGDTTNTNLGTLLEQSITGVLSVAQGDVANLTLTSLNGASDQARNAVVNLTGAMTAARNMVVPTANKLYLVKNSTSGGFAVTVKTVAGTGVAIPPLTSRWVYCDGTNVVDGLPGVVSGYTTTATAASTTTLTSGSTYFQYFTGATTQTITLPVTSTLVAGQPFFIVNESSGALTVNSSGGNLVTTIAAGGSSQIVCILTSGTSAASWDAISIDLSAYLPLAGGTMTGQLINTGSSAGYTPFLGVSTESGAAAGPIAELYRNSTTPAINDILGQWLFTGEDSAGNTQEYGSVQAVIVSPTSTTEASTLDFYTQKGGSRVLGLSLAGPVANAPSFAAGYTTTATAAGTTTLTVSSNQQQYFTGTTTQTVVLPVTSTLVLGQSYRVVNNSTGAVTVQSSGANLVALLTAGAVADLTCILTSGTSAASWDARIGVSVTLSTTQATTSGTVIGFTGLPVGVKVIDVPLRAVSQNSAAQSIVLQIGPSGGYTTTGYASVAGLIASGTNITGSVTAGFPTSGSSVGAAATFSGLARMVLLDPSVNSWSFEAVMADTVNGEIHYGSGSIALSGPLERVSLSTAGAAATFDGGSINILYWV